METNRQMKLLNFRIKLLKKEIGIATPLMDIQIMNRILQMPTWSIKVVPKNAIKEIASVIQGRILIQPKLTPLVIKGTAKTFEKFVNSGTW